MQNPLDSKLLNFGTGFPDLFIDDSLKSIQTEKIKHKPPQSTFNSMCIFSETYMLCEFDICDCQLHKP